MWMNNILVLFPLPGFFTHRRSGKQYAEKCSHSAPSDSFHTQREDRQTGCNIALYFKRVFWGRVSALLTLVLCCADEHCKSWKP